MKIGPYTVVVDPLLQRYIDTVADAAELIRAGDYGNALALLEDEAAEFEAPNLPNNPDAPLHVVAAWRDLVAVIPRPFQRPLCLMSLEVAAYHSAAMRHQPDHLDRRQHNDSFRRTLETFGLTLHAADDTDD